MLIIDIIGNIFNKQHEFYQTIINHKEKWLTSNLLVLTTLTAKLKRFLNVTFATEFHHIYGNAHNDTMTAHEYPIKLNAANESFVINLLTERLNGHGQYRNDAYKISDDDSILVHFNKTELNLIASVFEKLLNNGSCRSATTTHIPLQSPLESVSNMVSSSNVHNKQNNMAKLANDIPADGVNETLLMCATNNNSLTKCEMFLREKAVMLLANRTHSFDIAKVLCKQIQLWRLQNAKEQKQQQQQQQEQQDQPSQHHKSNGVPNILSQIVNRFGKKFNINEVDTIVQHRNDTNTNLFTATSDEFLNYSIPNRMGATFSENFPFFDFIVTKLAVSYNLTVNYNNQSDGFGRATLKGTASTADEIFEFCVLELSLQQITESGYDKDNSNYNNITHTNYNSVLLNGTQITLKTIWRPILILRQSEQHQNIFVTHPLLTIGYSWIYDNTNKFWSCGLLCWILAGIVILLLVCILVASITFGLAIR